MTETVTAPTAHAARVPALPAPRTLAVVGAGRAGTPLALAATRAGWRVTAVHSRSATSARRLAALTGAEPVPSAVAAMRAAAVTLVTVPDRLITSVAATVAATGMALPGRAVVHCAASRDRSALAALRITTAGVGAVHPLMALAGAESAGRLAGAAAAVDLDGAAAPVVLDLVAALGMRPLAVPPDARPRYHAAAVLAGSAPLVLLARAAGLLEGLGIDRAAAGEALATLLEGAAANARALGAAAALTGPVVRDDAATVAAHLDALGTDPAAQRLYRLLAEEALDLAGRAERRRTAAVLAPPQPIGIARPRRRPAA